jgi:hypothetical protein
MIALWNRFPRSGTSVKPLFVQQDDFVKIISQGAAGEQASDAGPDHDGAALLGRTAHRNPLICCTESV